MIVIGIDPGSRHFGYGIVDTSAGTGAIQNSNFRIQSSNSNDIRLIHADTINISHNVSLPERLKFIYESLLEVIEKYSPYEMAVEKIFAGKKIPSSFVLGYTRAIAFLVAAQKQISVYEYSSTEIKKALTGYGRAHKAQVKSMVHNFLSIDKKISYDCADALAVAICHIHSRKLLKVLK
ncbi:MAG: crossover junction endodeoxyribonuclease RuvC [Thermodesulfovibrio sp.]|jgi:crossover junction endodeoxyribonuclease RuvC|uniref:Crossover junction endodeoxyribonuclease RuvC n=1 Tax=Thermodesulfovibrio obliviosus TaxID=3118332 RepID=A0AAU8H525_9BACT